MFRQSIDPRGGFPPKASRKSKPKKAKKGLKKRKSKKQSFERERRAEQVFRFGEVRSGLSGRSVYNPNDFIRFHQSAQFNQQRDEAERTRRGGTFTGTSIGEERKVREAQEVDRRLKERELKTKERFAGALEQFVERIPKPQRQRVSTGDFDALLQPSETITLSDRPQREEVKSLTIEEIQSPPPIPQNIKGKRTQGTASQGIAREQPQPEPEPEPEPQIEPLLQEVSDDDPVPEEQGYSSHRKPEDDLNVKGSSSTGLPRQTSIGGLSRQTSGGSVIEAVTHSRPIPRPRPTPSNPSKTDTIPTIHLAERRTAEQVKPVVVPEDFEKKLQGTTTLQIKPEETKPKPKEEDIPDLEPTSSALSLGEEEDVLAFREGESISERAERLAPLREAPKPKFKVKTSETASKVEEDKPESELQKQLREKDEAERKRQEELVRQANAKREEKKRRIAESAQRVGLIPQQVPLREVPEARGGALVDIDNPFKTPPKEGQLVAEELYKQSLDVQDKVGEEVVKQRDLSQSVPTIQGTGQIEEDVGENWLDSLGQNTSFHSGKNTNQLTQPTFSFVDTDGIVGRGKFKGQEITVAGVNKNKNVLVQLSDTINGEKVGDDVRGNISFKKFQQLVEQGKIDLKPVQP